MWKLRIGTHGDLDSHRRTHYQTQPKSLAAKGIAARPHVSTAIVRTDGNFAQGLWETIAKLPSQADAVTVHGRFWGIINRLPQFFHTHPVENVIPPYLEGSMAIRVKDTGSLAKKFVQRAAAAGADYAEGVKTAGADWEAGARAGADNFAAGVQAAIADGRFAKGVANAGSAKYVNRAGTLGAQRFGPGVQAAEGDWAKGSQPYLDAIKSIELPPRRPKGDPGNQARAQAVAAKLRAIKLGK